MKLVSYFARRLFHLIPTAVGLTLITFLLGILSPGDPAYFALANDGFMEPSEKELDSMRKSLGLDQPLYTQYLRWVSKALAGDLGRSYRTGRPVAKELRARLPVSLNVAFLALAFTALIGLPLGIAAAGFQDTKIDRFSQGVSLCCVSVPGFWLAIFMILIFSEHLRLLPTSGYGSFRHLIMPSAALASGTIGVTIRLTRASLLEELHGDYVITARSKGLPYGNIVLRHGLKNSLIPVVTLFGTYLGNIIGGSALVESVFALPGMGQYALEGVMNRDFPVIQGYVLVSGSVFICMNLLIDALYLALDPQVRLGGKQK